MPIEYDSRVAKDLKDITDLAIRDFVMEILKNGSFLKKKKSIGNGQFQTVLNVGVTISFQQKGSTIVIARVK